MKHKPVYNFCIEDIEGKPTLLILDLFDEKNPTMSVTNGAEIVLKEIREKIGPLPEEILYMDTEGRWDRIIAAPDLERVAFAPL